MTASSYQRIPMLSCCYVFTLFAALTLTTTESFTFSSCFVKPLGASLRPDGDGMCQMRTPPGFSHHQSTNNNPRGSSSIRLHLLGGLFGSDKKMDGEDLASYKISIKDGGDAGGGSNAVGALTEYVIQWAHLFEGPGGIHLTTPARVQPTSTGVQILFQKGNTGYADKDKKDDNKKNDEGQTSSKQKNKNAKQGGVEVVVSVDDKDSSSVRVVARRCDMEEDTMIKEMSEATILHELQEAINVWKKNHSN